MIPLRIKNLKLKANHGFTLLELLLSLAVIALIAGLSIPIYQSFQVRNDLDVAEFAVVELLHRAQISSQAVEGDSPWGVNLSNNSITLFKGSSFIGREVTFDETFETPSVTASGLQEIIFSKFTGEPQSTGTTILTSTSNEQRQITINQKGTITY